ncbi:MAG: AAA family ATPase, partial [Victivallales bacterium]|nr:AAA family ATPase [Victivallales bacterium]
MLQPILIDSSDFAEIRENGCIYIDKTAYFHELITRRDARRFFLSRPRRFGKSLMITTLKAIFEGRRELFDGLAISKTDWKWEKYHVMHFNFMRAATSIPEEFKSLFKLEVRRGIVKAGGTYDPQQSAAGNFGNAIEELFAASKGKGVVVLIDEYDAPVARLLDKPDDADKIRGMLADFYGQMKDRTPCIRFLMITGVSRFTKMSMFSALSNLTNLSMDDQYATMLGYTEEELDRYFGDHLRAHAEKMKLSDDKYRAELKRWFNGYRFGQTLPATVYNPVSIGINLSERNSFFKASWAETGKASMLMNSV